jgi:hypothetical protein
MQKEMDQEGTCKNMNSNLEKNWDVDQEMYETASRGIVLEPKILQTKKQPTRHHVSSIDIGAKKEVWTGGFIKIP